MGALGMGERISGSDDGGPPFHWQGVRRGFLRGQPLAFATFVYGIAFGLLAREVGLSVLDALLMSATVYSGSAQLAALTAMQEATPWTDVSLWVIATTILIVNARYLLYGATLRPWLGQTNPAQAYSTLFVLGDGNWIMSMRAHSDGEHDAGFIFGSGLTMFLGWLSGTVVGSLAGALIANPAVLGLDFLLVSFCAASGIAMFRGRQDLSTVIAAALAAFVVSRFVSGGWPIIAAGVVGGVVAALRHIPARKAS